MICINYIQRCNKMSSLQDIKSQTSNPGGKLCGIMDIAN